MEAKNNYLDTSKISKEERDKLVGQMVGFLRMGGCRGFERLNEVSESDIEITLEAIDEEITLAKDNKRYSNYFNDLNKMRNELIDELKNRPKTQTN